MINVPLPEAAANILREYTNPASGRGLLQKEKKCNHVYLVKCYFCNPGKVTIIKGKILK